MKRNSMRKYLIAGGALILLVGIFLFLRTGSSIDNSTDSKAVLVPANSFSHAHGLAVDVVDATRVYIATHEGLYVLRNDKDLFRIGSTRNDLMGFSSHPTRSNMFFSSGHPAGGGNLGFQKTVDGGATWERVSPGLDGPADFHTLTVSTADPQVVFGFFKGKLQRSGDSGKSWEYAKGTVAPLSLASHPTLPGTVYAATPRGLLVSEDKGDTWKSVSSQLEGGAVSVFALQPTDSRHALTYSERLGGLGKSVDGGITWQRVSAFGGGAVLHFSFSKSKPDIVYALTNSNNIFKSTDRGSTWSKIR